MEIKNKKPIAPNNKTFDTLSALVLICGIGILFGLLVYGSFELNKKNKITITPTTKPVESPKPSELSYFGNEFIQVKIPQKNSAIKNPVIVEGKANVFEANVRIKIKDDSGNILADTFATAEDAYDKLYPFKTEINYNAPATQKGTIEVFEENAKDGSEINKVVVPVVFDKISEPHWITVSNCTGVSSIYSIDAPGFYTWTPNSGCLNGGRWPTLTELQCVYTNNKNLFGPFRDRGSYYWSSTEVGNIGNAWYVDFNNGSKDGLPKDNGLLVRCVR